MIAMEAPEIRAHVGRIAASPQFAESDRLRRFLEFTVESKLTNQAERVKEYVLGRQVFDRDNAYDPRMDPIVRVEARRLRTKLAEYYSGPGLHERVRVEYPKGSYLPQFRYVDPGAPAYFDRPKKLKAGIVVVAVVVVAALATLAYRAFVQVPANLMAVLPAQWVFSGDRNIEPAAIAIAQDVTSALANNHAARVVAWPVIARTRIGNKPLAQFASELHASKLLVISVRYYAGTQNVAVFAMNPATGEKVRSLQYTVPGVENPVAQEALAAQIAADLKR